MNSTLSEPQRAQEQRRAEAAIEFRRKGYPAQGWRIDPYAPALWVTLVWTLMVSMLYVVGYLDVDDDHATKLNRLTSYLTSLDIDVAARRAARGFSGVTLAITLALSITSLVWAGAAFRRKANHFRWPALGLMGVLLILCLGLSWWVSVQHQPFPSKLGYLMLGADKCGKGSLLAPCVPNLMFVLACVVPCILLAGATFLLQPMAPPDHLKAAPAAEAVVVKDQQKILLERVRELDQMLYIGALALVFGTLQLSAGLSVPLASMPQAATLKARADLCKLISPSSTPSAFFAPASSPTDGAKAVDATCSELPKQLVNLESAESLRQLARGVTLCFGLAFSALLAAVYVPTLVGLGLMIDERRGADDADPAPPASTKTAVELDPLHRVAAVFATLSPLLAGLVANTLTGG